MFGTLGVRAIFLVALFGTLGVGAMYFHHRWYSDGVEHQRLVDQKAADVAREAAYQALQLAQRQAAVVEAANQKLSQQVEEQHNATQQAITKELAANRELARTRGLWIKSRAADCAGSNSVSQAAASSSVHAPATAESQLPDEVTEFLLTFAAQCDEAASYAQQCRAWSLSIGTH